MTDKIAGNHHITLSTGSLAFSGCALGWHAITVGACIGIAIIGLLNFGVSFALALLVALRAKEVTGRERLNLAASVLRRFVRHPLQFFFPPRQERLPTNPAIAAATDVSSSGHH